MKHILIKTDLSSLICYHKLVHEIYPHIRIMTTSVKLPTKLHFTVYTCCDQYTLRKYSGLVFYLLTFQSTALIRINSLGNLVLFLICVCFICISDKKTLYNPTW